MNRTPNAVLDPLESRTLLSSSSLASGTLVVQGTAGDDFMTISIRLASDRTKQLRAIINGTVRNFDLTGVHQIQIEALAGSDRVFIDKNVVRGILVNGGIGDDQIVGGSGTDTLIGGRGFDTLQGNDGNDYLKGYSERDLLIGGNGNDTLDGGDDDDMLQANNGDDVLIGGRGADQMFGQDGNDSFFARDGSNSDSISGGDGDNRAQRDAGDVMNGIESELP